jgi:RimJ/RimL family protein N-acetyltransferase
MFRYENIAMRPIEASDLEDMRQLRNDQTTWQYLSDATLISPEMQLRWFENNSRSLDDRYYAIVLPDENNRFIGIIRTDEIDYKNRSIRVGLDIIPEERGKGYGTLGYRMLFKYFFDYHPFRRLWLCVLEDNEIAKKLYKRVGFIEEGRLRQAIWRNAKWKDYIIMSILDNEYRQSR